LNAVRSGIPSIEHGIFMTDECIEEMLTAGTYLVPTFAAVGNIMSHADQGIPDYVIEKAGGSWRFTKSRCGASIKPAG
jgi:imidazolonepropionase-like amidohydrolase